MANNAKCWRLTLALHPGYPHKRVDTPRHQDADWSQNRCYLTSKFNIKFFKEKTLG
jgi:hypothetical protein